ncbi:MAG TPA: PD-(D/E)XK nuclease-like domain-containing protein [Microbacteriaceae bacterium]|nr:PD-(D/E)XK nuclease-like domain-containing protein [Microbacteriaceae bacterium]
MSALTGIVHGLPEADYHARPELSSTEARLILESPAKYRWKKDHPPLVAPSKKFDIGSAVHSKVLGTGYDVAVIPDEILASNGAISTKEAKAFVDEARADGKIPLKRVDFEPIDAAAESVLAHPTARALFDQPGDAEVSVFAEIDGVPVRARFDFLPEQSERRRVAVDLKTARDASFREFERSIASLRYDVQRSWYLAALDAVTGPMPHGLEPEFVYVAVEKEPPYLVGVHAITPQWAAIGDAASAKARRLYASCMEAGVWPGYPEEIQYHAPPTWLVIQAEEDDE